MWNSGGSPAQNAYFLTVDLWSDFTTFVGVRGFALDRASMMNGGPANAIAFTIPPAGLGNSLSLLAANFRNGTVPPVGEDEFLLAIDSTIPGTLNQVKGWRFHVDFATPANSTLGIGANLSKRRDYGEPVCKYRSKRPCPSRILTKSWIPWATD